MTLSKKNENTSIKANFLRNLTENHRIATRCIREDISAAISDLGLLNFGKVIDVKLIDITSKGVLIATNKKLRINQKFTLTLRFNSGKTFIIKATVARISASADNQYGIKFDRYNDELGDYLLETQSKLVFK